MYLKSVKELLPAWIIIFASVILATIIIYASPLITHGQIAGCPSGTVRTASASDVSQAQTILGSSETTIALGTCMTQSDINRLGLDQNTAQAIQDLSQNFICPSYQAGYNANVSATTLKNGYIYFSYPTTGGTISINPKFVVCVDTFLKAAKQVGYNPCLTAALRTAVAQQASCQDQANSVVCGRQAGCSLSFIANSCPHVAGIAVDVKAQNGNQSGLQSFAQTSNSGLYFPLPTTDPVHVQPKTAACGLGSSAAPITPSTAITQAIQSLTGQQQQSNIYSTPGVGSSNAQNVQAYCSGNTIMYQDTSGNVTEGATCPSGCLNGACSQTTCGTGYSMVNGTCTPQSCGSGYTMNNGVCYQNSTGSNASTATGAATGATGSTANTASRETGSSPTSPTTATKTTVAASTATPTGTTVTTSSITSPQLVTNLGTSTLDLLNELAHPQTTNPTTTASTTVSTISITPGTTTPITLPASASDISQLQASPLPAITEAQPTSALFASTSGYNGSQQSGTAAGSTAGSNSIVTTSGSGYETASNTSGNNDGGIPAAGIAESPTPPTADTFTSGDMTNASGSVSTAAPSAASTFVSNTLSILNTLRLQVIGALDFLATYTKPFGGVPANQEVE